MLISSISFPDLISLLYGYPWKKGLGWKEAQRQGDCTNNFSIYTYTSQNINTGRCKCMWQIFTLASCKCNKNIYIHCNRISVIKVGRVNVNDLHLLWIYTPYIWLLTLTHTTLVQTNVGRCLLLWWTYGSGSRKYIISVLVLAAVLQ